MKMIIEVTTYVMVDVQDEDRAQSVAGRLAEEVADWASGFSRRGVHMTTVYGAHALGEAPLTKEAVQQASQELDARPESQP
jgi:hypothetical protein